MLQIRDYIHVVDLADGHIAALNKLFDAPDIGTTPANHFGHHIHMFTNHIQLYLTMLPRSYPWAGCVDYNLGTGRGTSVLEMVAAFKKASGKVLSVHGSCLYDLIRRKGPETDVSGCKTAGDSHQVVPQETG